MHRELIESCGMIYLIVDNRAPEEVEHWPAFAQWWAARRALVGPQQERTDVLWVQATHVNGQTEKPTMCFPYQLEHSVLSTCKAFFSSRVGGPMRRQQSKLLAQQPSTV